jgi:excisionase family DNA binding protein
MSEQQSESRQWYTVAEACEYLRVSNTTIYEYMKSKRLPFFYLAGTRNRRLKKSDLDALLEPGNPSDPAEGDG